VADPTVVQRFGREFPRGSVVFHEGDPGREMYVIQAGRVTISKRVGAVEKVLATLGQGEFFGEMAIVSRRPRSATATCEVDARLLVVDHATFEAMVRSNAEIALRMIQKLAERLREADDLISNMLLRDGASRVVHFLATQAERVARGPGPVRLAARRDALPALVGVDAAQVDAAIEKLLRARIVALEEGAIVVADPAKLHHLLEFLEMRSPLEDAP